MAKPSPFFFVAPLPRDFENFSKPAMRHRGSARVLVHDMHSQARIRAASLYESPSLRLSAPVECKIGSEAATRDRIISCS
jgi:hypothetical protein